MIQRRYEFRQYVGNRARAICAFPAPNPMVPKQNFHHVVHLTDAQEAILKRLRPHFPSMNATFVYALELAGDSRSRNSDHTLLVRLLKVIEEEKRRNGE